jgi:hypothetical protein
LAANSFLVTGKEGSFLMDSKSFFDRWFPVDIAVNAKTMPGDRVKVKWSTICSGPRATGIVRSFAFLDGRGRLDGERFSSV